MKDRESWLYGIVQGFFLGLGIMGFIAAYADESVGQPKPTMITIPAPPPVLTLDDLLKGVHLYGCHEQEHPSGAVSACTDLRQAILVAAQRGALVARRHAFQDAAAVVRSARTKDDAERALDRRASD